MLASDRELRRFLSRYERITTQVACDRTRDSREHPRLAVWVREGVEWTKLSAAGVEALWSTPARKRARSFCNFLSRDLLKSSAAQYASIKRMFSDPASTALTGIYASNTVDSGDEPYAVVIELPTERSRSDMLGGAALGAAGTVGALGLVGAGLWLNRRLKLQNGEATSEDDFPVGESATLEGVKPQEWLKRDRMWQAEQEALDNRKQEWDMKANSRIQEDSAKAAQLKESQSSVQKLQLETARLREEHRAKDAQLIKQREEYGRTRNEDVRPFHLEIERIGEETKRGEAAHDGLLLQSRQENGSLRLEIERLLQVNATIKEKTASLEARLHARNEEFGKNESRFERLDQAEKDVDAREKSVREQRVSVQQTSTALAADRSAFERQLVEQNSQLQGMEEQLLTRSQALAESEKGLEAKQQELSTGIENLEIGRQTLNSQVAAQVQQGVHKFKERQQALEAEMTELQVIVSQCKALTVTEAQLRERETQLREREEVFNETAAKSKAAAESQIEDLRLREAVIQELITRQERTVLELQPRERALALKETALNKQTSALTSAQQKLNQEVDRQVSERIKVEVQQCKQQLAEYTQQTEVCNNELAGLKQKIQHCNLLEQQMERSRLEVEQQKTLNEEVQREQSVREKNLKEREERLSQAAQNAAAADLEITSRIERDARILTGIQEESESLRQLQLDAEAVNFEIELNRQGLAERERLVSEKEQSIDTIIDQMVADLLEMDREQREAREEKLTQENKRLNETVKTRDRLVEKLQGRVHEATQSFEQSEAKLKKTKLTNKKLTHNNAELLRNLSDEKLRNGEIIQAQSDREEYMREAWQRKQSELEANIEDLKGALQILNNSVTYYRGLLHFREEADRDIYSASGNALHRLSPSARGSDEELVDGSTSNEPNTRAARNLWTDGTSARARSTAEPHS